jgi:hypothetical protein
LLYLIVFRITKNKGYLWPVFLCAVIFPLARPEGWWLLAVSCAILIFWHFKRNIVTGFTKMKSKILILIGGFMLSIYAAYDQFPIYKRLVRDWLEWPVTAGSYEQLGSGKFNLGAFQNIFLALFPSWERFRYLLKVEWLYGVLFFGFFTLLLIVTFFWTKKSNFFSRQGRIGISIALLLSFPFFTAFVSPQISPDHPWMLRRFLFAVLPLGIFSALMLGINFIKKLPLKYNFTMIAIYLVILLIPTLPATGYFLSAGINDGRKEALEQLADHLEKDDFIFLERGSSGDGWSMWSEPLSSIFGFNSAYVYSPKNISDLKPILYDRFSQGKRNFVVLPEKAYDYEHELQKDFNLILDKDLTFENTELKINKNTEYVNFPLLKRKEYLVKVYLLSPR